MVEVDPVEIREDEGLFLYSLELVVGNVEVGSNAGDSG